MREILIVLAAAGSVLFSGCASVGERMHGVLGTSIREIEASRVKSVQMVVPGDRDAVYTAVLAELKKAGRYIYRRERNEGAIAFYMSAENTTVAGVFLRGLEGGKTEIEIASPSSYARNAVREELSALLPAPEPEREPSAVPEENDTKPTVGADEQETSG